MMKFKEGSLVEVLVKDDFGNHSLRCARIVSGNGLSYSVSYNVYSTFTNTADVERVSAKSIRPCPPIFESPIVSCKTRKRSSPHSYFQDVANGKRARRKSPEKVVFVTNRKENLALEDNEKESIMSSSDSCSTNNSYKPYGFCRKSCPVEDTESHESDAESVCQMGYHDETYESEETDRSPTNEELVDGIHRLELDAYRSTMVALHAAGPLTWEKESVVTNLRISLHISNDEHLIMGLLASTFCFCNSKLMSGSM